MAVKKGILKKLGTQEKKLKLWFSLLIPKLFSIPFKKQGLFKKSLIF